MPNKNITLEWQEGRSAHNRSHSLRTDGTFLYSYAMPIGSRGLDGKTVALREFNVSAQTNPEMHYAGLTADRISWGMWTPHKERRGWWDDYCLITDPAMIGQTLTRQLTEPTARKSTSIKRLDALAAGSLKRWADGLSIEDRSWTHEGLGVFKVNPVFVVVYSYVVTADDIVVK